MNERKITGYGCGPDVKEAQQMVTLRIECTSVICPQAIVANSATVLLARRKLKAVSGGWGRIFFSELEHGDHGRVKVHVSRPFCPVCFHRLVQQYNKVVKNPVKPPRERRTDGPRTRPLCGAVPNPE